MLSRGSWYRPRRFDRVAALAALALIVGAGGLIAPAARAAEPVTLTLYSGQPMQTVDRLIAAFARESGIKVRVHEGEGPEIANQIAQEGAYSHADVVFVENSPELVLLDEKKLLAPVAPAVLKRIPARFSAQDGHWLGVLARENVLAFNPALIGESALPASLTDLARPQWKGKIAIAPSDADFLPLVRAVEVSAGKPAALAWLKGLKANAQVFDDDEGVVAAVERGSVAAGIINNYYWARLRTETGAAKMRSRIYHFSHGDIGGLINVSGVAVLKSSKHPAAAQRFLAFLVSRPAQEMLARGEIDFEYPLLPGVPANPLLKPFDQLQPPAITMAELGDDQASATLLREAGLL